MDALQESFYTEHQTETLILFKIISLRSWDELQDLHKSFPASRIDHVMAGTGIFVLTVGPAGESEELAA